MTDTVTKDDIVKGFARLGIEPVSHVIVQASLSKFGHVEGGADTVVDAMREATGKEGAVLIPAFLDAIRSDHYALRQCNPECPRTLCPSTERSYTGKIGETVRQQPDALRSCHPTHSWTGVGGDAKYLMEGHGNSPTPCGKDSPFFPLMEKDGFILQLGIGVNFTNLHTIEDVLNLPYLSAIDPPRRHATYTTSARRTQYTHAHLLEVAFREAGLLRSTQIGQSTCHALPARGIGAFLWLTALDDPWCLALRPGPDTYDPDQDAQTKISRMLAVWRRNPDVEAWRRFLEESKKTVEPVMFEPAAKPETQCPAYRGVIRGYHRCAANDIPPWEGFDQHPRFEPGVATCGQCNWPQLYGSAKGDAS